MPDIIEIGRSRDSLAQLLDLRRELRREMITFLLSLSDIWKNFPSELSPQSKIDILKESVKIFFEELDYSAALLDQQNEAVMQTFGLEIAALKERLQDLDKLAAQAAKFEKQQTYLHKILEALDARSYLPETDAELTSGHADSDIFKLKQHIELLQISSRQLSDLVVRLTDMVKKARKPGLFHRYSDIKLEELVDVVEKVTGKTII